MFNSLFWFFTNEDSFLFSSRIAGEFLNTFGILKFAISKYCVSSCWSSVILDESGIQQKHKAFEMLEDSLMRLAGTATTIKVL